MHRVFHLDQQEAVLILNLFRDEIYFGTARIPFALKTVIVVLKLSPIREILQLLVHRNQSERVLFLAFNFQTVWRPCHYLLLNHASFSSRRARALFSSIPSLRSSHYSFYSSSFFHSFFFFFFSLSKKSDFFSCIATKSMQPYGFSFFIYLFFFKK